MAKVGRTIVGTMAKVPITFAMVELADSADCNDRKRLWLNYKFKDVTPMFGPQSTVPSLNDSKVAAGRKMLTLLQSVDADWYMVSGHHGALYQSDYGLFTRDGQPLAPDGSNMDPMRVANDEEFCGFFNEAYHEGRWDHSSRTDPEPASVKPAMKANEIYLRTTSAAPAAMAPFSQTNPLLDATHKAPKGIIIAACNTLIYRKARVTWASAFPNSVIFGAVSRIAQGTWITNAIGAAKLTDEKFWRDPQSVLDQAGMCDELIKQLVANFPKGGSIGFVYKQKFFWGGRHKSDGKAKIVTQAVDAPLQTS